VTRWENLNACPKPEKTFDFARKRYTTTSEPRVEEGSYPKRITGRVNLCAIRVTKGELSKDFFGSVKYSELFNHWNQTLTVASATAFTVHREILVVVDFPIAHKHPIIPQKWLHSVHGCVVDCEPAEHHCAFTLCDSSLIIGAAMSKVLWKGSIEFTKNANDSTHLESYQV
jgi:hypothetical protein